VDSLPPVAAKKKNPWTSTSEIILWLLFVALIFPAAFAGYAVGHYTSLGKPPKTVTVTTAGGSTSESTPTTTEEMTTTTSSSGGDTAAGKTVFASESCGGCHTFNAAGSNGSIGPDLDTAIATDASAAHEDSLEDFVKESIVDPEKYIAQGYPGGVMPSDFGKKLTRTQLDDLVAFIVSNTNQ